MTYISAPNKKAKPPHPPTLHIDSMYSNTLQYALLSPSDF